MNFATNLSDNLIINLSLVAAAAKKMFFICLDNTYGHEPANSELLASIKADAEKSPDMFYFFTEFVLNGMGGEIRDGELTMDELRDPEHLAEVINNRFEDVYDDILGNEGYREYINFVMTDRISQLSQVGWFGIRNLDNILELLEAIKYPGGQSQHS